MQTLLWQARQKNASITRSLEPHAGLMVPWIKLAKIFASFKTTLISQQNRDTWRNGIEMYFEQQIRLSTGLRKQFAVLMALRSIYYITVSFVQIIRNLHTEYLSLVGIELTSQSFRLRRFFWFSAENVIFSWLRKWIMWSLFSANKLQKQLANTGRRRNGN